MKNVLFIGHEAGLSGAPMVLLHFLRWLRANNSELHVDLLLLTGGKLLEEYSHVSDVYILPSKDRGILGKAADHLKKRLSIESKIKPVILPPFSRSYDLVVGNTIVSLEYLKFFKKKNFQTICWLHELEFVVKSHYSEEKFVHLCSFVDRFIAVSNACRQMLEQVGIEKPIDVIYEFSRTKVTAITDVTFVKDSLGIPPEAFVVGGSGTIEWRKGVDIFLQAALRLSAQGTSIYFVWVGAPPKDVNEYYRQLMHDCRHAGLESRVIFTGSLTDPHPIFAAMDVFTLTSREDPFPLVCLEAASLAKPIICFAGAGGMPEFVEEDAGVVVPYGDVEKLCETILAFQNDTEYRLRTGKKAHAKIADRFSADSLSYRLNNILTSSINASVNK